MHSAKLFMNGQSQAVRLPKEFRFEGKEVYIKRVGDVVMLIPKDRAWEAMERSLEMFTSDFLPERPKQLGQKREDLFDE